MLQQFGLNHYTSSIIHNRDEVPYQRAGSQSRNDDQSLIVRSNIALNINPIANSNNNNGTIIMTQSSSIINNNQQKCSFPKKSLFYKIIGPLTMVLMITSITILIAKRCTQAITSEKEARQFMFNSINLDDPFEFEQQQQRLKKFIENFFLKHHILHGFGFFGSIMIILYCYVNLVPLRNVDFKYAFHILSIFVLFCISISTLYASFVAYERPCLSPEGTVCCQVIGTPGLLDSNEKKSAITSISSGETSMIMVMLFDLSAGLSFFITTVVYFRHVRQDAAECGYLERVHNESYIVR